MESKSDIPGYIFQAILAIAAVASFIVLITTSNITTQNKIIYVGGFFIIIAITMLAIFIYVQSLDIGYIKEELESLKSDQD